MGAELNAGTGKDSTSVYSRVLDVSTSSARSTCIADMVWRPALAERDLDAEREIVLEEIAMYEDDPQDQVFDLLGEAVFGDHPLGPRRHRPRATVVAAPAPTRCARSTPSATRPATSSSPRPDRSTTSALVELVRAAEAAARGARRAPAPAPPPAAAPPARRFLRKDTEQYHSALGGPGIARDDERRFALRVLDTILGGTSSSRLFQEVREQPRPGLQRLQLHEPARRRRARSASTSARGPTTSPRRCGSSATSSSGCSPTASRDDELARAKDHAKGRIVLSLESTSARMTRLGSAVLAGLPLLSVDELIERVDAVTAEDVDALARELLAPERLQRGRDRARRGRLPRGARAASSPELAVAA